MFDLSPLAGLRSLETLELPMNCITEAGLDVLARLPRLRVLNIAANRISSLAGLEGATSLEVLSAYGNDISDLGPVAALGNLRTLDLTGNRVVSLAPLVSLGELRVLRARVNAVTDLAPLAELAELAVLDVGFNDIRDLLPLASCSKLAVLLADGNRIDDVSELAGLPSIHELNLAHNNLRMLAGLSELLAAGDSVDLRWNQLDLSAGGQVMTELEYLSEIGVTVVCDPQR